MRLPLKLLIWIAVSVLYVAMFYPALVNLAVRPGAGLAPDSLALGVGIMVLGLGLEAMADHQKSRFKREQPDRFCDVGLYRVVRCPNYLGEITVWVGQFVAGVAAFEHWSHWVVSGFGLLCIQLIMVGSTKRLESTQGTRYGERDDYQHYIKTVPVLYPFVPVYSLAKVRVYLE